MRLRLPPSALDRAAWALLCLFVFSVPWEKSVWVHGIGTISRLLGIVAFAAGAVVAFRRRAIRPPNIALVLAGIFVLWSALTYGWSLDRPATRVRVVTLVELFAMLWLVWDSCRRPLRQRRLIEAYVLGAVTGSCVAFVRYIHDLQTYYRRYAAPGFDPNDFGLVLALSIPLSLYLALSGRGRMRWCWRAATLIVISAVLLTASRTALIATFIAFSFALWTWRKADFSQRVSSVLLAALLALGLLRFAPAPSRQRLATIPSEISRGTFHGRAEIWKSGVRAWKSHPVLGVGSGAYPEAVRPWLGRPDVPGIQYVAHNTFLSVLVECGVIGFGLYALLLGVLFLFVWMMPSPERALWAVMLAVWAAGVSTLTWEHYKPTWLMFALIMTEWARSWWLTGKGE